MIILLGSQTNGKKKDLFRNQKKKTFLKPFFWLTFIAEKKKNKKRVHSHIVPVQLKLFFTGSHTVKTGPYIRISAPVFKRCFCLKNGFVKVNQPFQTSIITIKRNRSTILMIIFISDHT